MCRLICITNRKLCRADFTERVRQIIDLKIPVILREKDLCESQYYDLLCAIGRREIIAHSFIRAAEKFGCAAVHLPMTHLEQAEKTQLKYGASVHSPHEAKRAKSKGAAYVTAGHVFATDCKPGLPPRGTRLISEIKAAADIRVYALGGITPENAERAIAAGADGVAVMSGFMQCTDIYEYIKEFSHILS